MTTIWAQAENKIELGFEDVVTFLKSDVWPFMVTLAKNIEADFLKAALPIAQNAVNEIAASAPTLLSNPAVIGQIVGTTASQLVQAGVAVAEQDATKAATTAAIAVGVAIQNAMAALNAAPATTP